MLEKYLAHGNGEEDSSEAIDGLTKWMNRGNKAFKKEDKESAASNKYQEFKRK